MTDHIIRTFQESYESGLLKPNQLDDTGLSLSHKMAADGELTCLKLLINFGGDPCLRSSTGATPAHFAASNGHLHILQYLHEINKDAVSLKDNTHVTPLYIAAQEGQLDCLIWLIKNSSTSPNVKTINGMTPCHVASQEGKLECLRYLLKAAHAVFSKDNEGRSFLHYAAAEGHSKVIQWLIKHCGLNPDEKDKTFTTPLHIAAWCGHDKAIETLIACGANVDCVDSSNKKPLDYAKTLGKKSTANILFEAMSKATEHNSLKRVRFEEHQPASKKILTLKSKEKNRMMVNDEIMFQFDTWSDSSTTKNKRNKRELYKTSNNLFKHNLNDDFDQINIGKFKMQKNNNIFLDSPAMISKYKNNVTDNGKQSTTRQFEERLKHIDHNSTKHNNTLCSQTSFSNRPASKSNKNNINLPSELPRQSSKLNRHFINKSYLCDSNLVNFSDDNDKYKEIQERSNYHKRDVINYKKDIETANNLKQSEFLTVSDFNEKTNYIPQSYYKKKLQSDNIINNKYHNSTKYTRETLTPKIKPNNHQSVPYSLHELKLKRSNNRLTNIEYNKVVSRDLDITPARESEKFEFFSSNLVNNKKSNWSNIRNGLTSFFTGLRSKPTNQNQDKFKTLVTRAPREDIFSRFNKPNKSSRIEFHDLFNSSTVGTYTINNASRLTPANENRHLTFDDFSRVKSRALDTSLRGKNKIFEEHIEIQEKQASGDKLTGSAFIW
ncbi:inversin-B isoform X4 [Hydra vulgaris]|uniref:inversin-B isoform X4 n=1 Tax=Hydra vulgaris TaxID=6087 RepID=UPI0006413948|nr:inversin-B isoform X2 [Hydra vulgaris]